MPVLESARAPVSHSAVCMFLRCYRSIVTSPRHKLLRCLVTFILRDAMQITVPLCVAKWNSVFTSYCVHRVGLIKLSSFNCPVSLVYYEIKTCQSHPTINRFLYSLKMWWIICNSSQHLGYFIGHYAVSIISFSHLSDLRSSLRVRMYAWRCAIQ